MWGMAGRVVNVTGGGNGIGRATAQLFAEQGAAVVIADRDAIAGLEAEEQIQRRGGTATFLDVDVSSSDQVQEMVKRVDERFGRLDVLFANAAVQLTKPVAETTEEEWDRLQSVNLKGVFLCCKWAIPLMKKQEKAAVVITASGHANVTYPNCSAYASTKGALVSFMRGVALDCAASGIRVNCVLPGTTDTRLVQNYVQESPNPEETRRQLLQRIPLKRFATPEDIGHAVLFLASDYASFITGTTLIVDGGQLAQG